MKPPYIADRLLNWFCAPHLREEVLGDLHERYALWAQQRGEANARWRYWREVLAYVRPSIIKRQPSAYPNPTTTDMLRNYLKIAFRTLVKNKGYSFINIGGLAVGMAVAMLIGLWVYDELSFNTYHKNYDRIAQIMQNQVVHDETKTSQSLPYPFIHELTTNYKRHFKHIVTSTHTGDHILSSGEKKLSKKGRFIGAEAPELFTLHMLKGTWAGLQDQQSILLSASTASALFGDTDPMGKQVKISTDKDVRVTGVYEDLPQNTQLQDTQFLASWDYFVATNAYMSQKKWDNHALFIYVEIQPNTDFDKVTASIKDSELNVIRRLESMKEEAATNPQMWLNPMRNWHLYSDFKNGVISDGPIQYVWIVGLIGFFVLLLACINFMNLSTARSEQRAREVGIRKAIGSLRIQLIGQFFSESFLVVLLAFTLAILLVTMTLPWFNDLAAKQMTILWGNGLFWLSCLGFMLLTGLLAGSYPALYLTSFQPVKVLKGAGLARVQMGRFASLPRQVLVIMQFTVSISLIIYTLVVYRQVQFAKNRPIGYSRAGLLMVPMQSDDFNGKTDLLRTELKNTGAVTNVAESQSPITGVWSTNEGFRWKGLTTASTDQFATLSITPEYAQAVGWQFVAGRNFSKEFASDSSGFVINETAAKLMGLQKPVGETIHWKSQWMTNNIEKPFRIIGVVKDMVMESPFQPIKPTVFCLFGNPNWINIRLNPAISTSDALPKIEAVFKKLIPSAPFEYKFADDEYAAKFRTEERIGKLTSFFAVLAILISCLGLFGLASYVAEQRTKEIGVRKVLGASVLNLWGLLSKDFVVLVGIGFGIATPIAYYFLTNWLQKYEYRTEISWWIFALSGSGALLLTLLTVSFQSMKAALMNPVKSLRSE
ncbi:FtsX-like permease family protein [Spirosoma sp. HMF4905]|uniref:FtsX-like permease family protein n=1 Tax=Spirosoma arboris TaxID=2682092 RepID=A0A7K1SJ01_9BACT|nr:ABC transporter permease [Spirosoma arboris]MVM33799.1 FtsX-like permease family protein [Spirosoma arboris]